MSWRWPLLSLGCLLVACDAGDAGSVSPTSYTPVKIFPAAVGSYQLSFLAVAFSDHNSDRKPVSEGLSARLDIRQAGDAYQAVFTPAWGSPSTFKVATELGRIVLTGYGQVGGNEYDYHNTFDRWTRIELPQRADGSFTGTFVATGQGIQWSGDVETGKDIAGDGDLVADGLTPEIRWESSSLAPPGEALPWDPIVVRASEGVENLAESLRAIRAGAGPLDSHWTLRTADPSVAWAGGTMAEGRLLDWESLEAVQVIGGPLVDPRGNRSGDLTALPILLSVPAPGILLDFDDSSAPAVAMWGGAVVLGEAGSDGLHCEAGGCVKLGPFQTRLCGDDRIGFAGRLATAGFSKVEVRYRVLMEGDEYSEPNVVYAPFVFELASIGQPAAQTKLEPTLRYSETPVLPKYNWGTDWETLTVLLPSPGAAEHGFALHGGERPSGIACVNAPYGARNAVVLVDSIKLAL